MAAAALRAAVRQLFHPHLNPKPSLGSTLLHSPPKFKSAHVGTLEILNPVRPRLASLQTGAAAKLGGPAAPGPCSLGIARLARAMLNCFGVGVTAWAASKELTGGAWTAYASAPKRHELAADPSPVRASWPARSGPFLSSILTSSSPCKEKPNPGSPEASKNPLWETFEAKCALGSERASSPVLAAAYDSQWARARSPPTIGLTGVPSSWGTPEIARPQSVLEVLDVAKQAGGAPGAVEKETPAPTKGMRVGAQPSSSPSAGLGLLMEEPVLPLMAPNIGWELVTSGLGWKGASVHSPEVKGVRATAKEGGPARSEGGLIESSSWSLITVGGEASLSAEQETEGVRNSGPKRYSSTSPEVGTLENVHIAASQHPKCKEQSVQQREGESSSDGAPLSNNVGKADNKNAGAKAGQESKSGDANEPSEDRAIEAAAGRSPHQREGGRPGADNPCTYATPSEPLKEQAASMCKEASAPSTKCDPDKPSSHSSSPATVSKSIPDPIAKREQQNQKESSPHVDLGALESGERDPPGGARNSGSVLQRRVSAPIGIHQGRAEGRPFAASAPEDRNGNQKRTELTSQVNEVRLLGEALCHSQTRARMAEEREAATFAENIRLKQLLFSETLQKNTWQICLAIQTADVSLLPVATGPLLSESQQPATDFCESKETRGYEHAGREGERKTEDDGETDKGIDFVDCVITIAFGVALGVVCFGNWGFGWFILRSM